MELPEIGSGARLLALPVPVRPPDGRTIEEIRDGVRREALELAGEALHRLADLMRGGENERTILAACVAIMDRAGVIAPSAASLVSVTNIAGNLLVTINKRRQELEGARVIGGVVNEDG